ncbi:hypothetical protein AB0L82_24395 [Nocardia sp. NPDC052001]|uniref:NACHT and WD repeat domain-containing protein n=1 Tax=Nocardia sp. NPDC052001 TaxID=3154853 RepID=UPI0034464D06
MPTPRAVFAERFAELYAAAGNPTLRRVATIAENRMRAAQGSRAGGGASAQRISDWKAGRNVPARFESLLPVVLTLVELARNAEHPLTRELAEPKEWQRIWLAATSWSQDDAGETDCPYPGLTSYAAANQRLFFGRDRATAELAELVRTAHGPVAVIGASGAGKSSLLAAGLAPVLGDWRITALTPGAHPLTALAAALELAEPSTAMLRPAEPSTAVLGPDESPGAALEPVEPPVTAIDGSGVADSTAAVSIDALTTALGPSDGPRRLLIIDQFEELFTTCVGESEREEFLRVLNECATRGDDPVAVVMALRADFYAQCLNYRVLQHALEQRSYLLGPMRPDELAQAISGPARTVGLTLEPGLEELVITELCGVGDQHDRSEYHPGALPLLSHVMAATWQHRDGRKLTVAGYRRAGGVVGSVTETAEHAWNELTDPQRTAAKDILLGLIAVSQNSRDTRRRAQRPELLRRAADPEAATAALELLAATRLITLDADTVTLTHEIVLTAWPRLRAWIDEDRVGYLVRQRMELDAAEWAAQERDSSLLYRGTRLQNALEHANPPPLGPLAGEFLDAATTAHTRTRHRSSRIKTILALLGVALLALGFAAYTQTRLVEQQRDDKTFTAVLSEADRVRNTDPSLAAQLYLVARQLRPHDEDVRIRLLRTQAMPLANVNRVQKEGIWQQQYRLGKLLVTLGWSGELRRWDVSDPHHPLALGQSLDKIESMAVSPDGELLATVARDSGIRIWDVRDPAVPQQISELPAPGGSLLDMRFAGGDGRTLIVVKPNDLTFWSLRKPTAPESSAPYEFHRPAPNTPIPHLAVSPDGRMLAVSRDTDGKAFNQSIELLNLGDGQIPRVITDRLGPVDASIGDPIFSPDGHTLAVITIGSDSTLLDSKNFIQLWNITDPAKPQQVGIPIATGTTSISAMAYSPDGRILAISEAVGVALWNITEPTAPALITNELALSTATCRMRGIEFPCTGAPSVLDFTSDGRNLLASGAGGEILTWSLPPAILTGQAGTVSQPQFDSTGERMVTQSGDGRIMVWDLRNRHAPDRIGEYRRPPGIYEIQLSPDGRTLLLISGNRDTPLQLLDLTDPAHIRLRAEWRVPGDRTQAFQVSADWRTMATAGADGTVRLWDLSDPAHPRGFGAPLALHVSSATDLEFSADGKTLYTRQQTDAATNPEAIISRWNLTDPDHPRQQGEPLRLFDGFYPRSLRLSPDERTMVTINQQTIQLWDITDPNRFTALGDPIAAHSRMVISSIFTADGRTMATSSADGSIQLWDVTDRTHPRRIGAPLVEPWNILWTLDFTPDGHALTSVAEDGAILLWDLDEQPAIDRVCAITGKYWTPELWRRYLPQLPYHPPCD